ncbi:MAG: hypothetical protein IT567_00285 [Alphaproteobacteria bacterium]|nr:hypothetical protein [Alphaproteobacteria bacterium]
MICNPFVPFESFISELNAEEIIAVFTVIIGVATVFLWKATRDLVKGAEITSERQLRAYVSIQPIGIFNFGEVQPIEITYSLHNAGQTPATKVRVFSGMFALPYPQDFDFPKINEAMIASSTTLFPAAAHKGYTVNSHALPVDQVKAILDGTKLRLFFVGIIKYVDIFNKEHITKFCFSIGGEKFASMISRSAAAGGAVVDGALAFEHSSQHNEIG